MKLGAYDVGYSAKPTAGIGHLIDKHLCLRRVVGGVQAFCQLEYSQPYDVIAIDGPIIPTKDNSSLVRGVESLFQRGVFQLRYKCSASHVSGTGQQLRSAAAQAPDVLTQCAPCEADTNHPLIRGGRLVEAFPNAFLGVCITQDAFAQMPRLRRGKKFDWLYDQWLSENIGERLALDSPAEVTLLWKAMSETQDHEERAALVCLMTAACVACNTFTAVGDESGGWFFLPPWSAWADWAKEETDRQAERLTRCGQKIEIIRGSVR